MLKEKIREILNKDLKSEKNFHQAHEVTIYLDNITNQILSVIEEDILFYNQNPKELRKKATEIWTKKAFKQWNKTEQQVLEEIREFDFAKQKESFKDNIGQWQDRLKKND